MEYEYFHGLENEEEKFQDHRKTLAIPSKLVGDELSFQGEPKSTWLDHFPSIILLKQPIFIGTLTPSSPITYASVH